MVAFSAKSLVCTAMPWIRVVTSPTVCAPRDRARTISLVRRASSTARLVIWADSSTWRPICAMEADSSSVERDTLPASVLALAA